MKGEKKNPASFNASLSSFHLDTILDESKKCKQVLACGMKFLVYKKKRSHYCHLPAMPLDIVLENDLRSSSLDTKNERETLPQLLTANNSLRVLLCKKGQTVG